VVFLFLTVGLGPRFSFTSRIVIGFAVDVVVQILVPVINLGEVPKYAALSITLGGVFFTGNNNINHNENGHNCVYCYLFVSVQPDVCKMILGYWIIF
jgi:hypothetical protein